MEDKIKRSRIAITTDLTPGETLILWRKRRKWNQEKAAKHYKVSVFDYKLAEYDVAQEFKYRRIELKEVKDHERCFIYRRRFGMTQAEVAPKVGIGKYWLRELELGKAPCSRLLTWWETVVART